MIARMWRGATRLEDVDRYLEYLRETGLREYRATPGNRGAWALWRERDGLAEWVTLSFWESREAVEGFAGADISRAVFYPADDEFLVERELTVEHYEVGAE